MQISFSPQRRDETLTVSKAGDVLTINGAALDYSGVTDGYILPADGTGSEFVHEVRRVGGELKVSLTLPHGPNPPHAVAFPDPLIDVADGAVALPGDTDA